MKTLRILRSIAGCCLVIALGGGALGQSAPPDSQRIQIKGFLSTSFSHNLDQPAGRLNQFRVFDQEDDTFLLDVVELSAQSSPLAKGQAGFRCDVTAGSSIPRATASAGLFRDKEKRAADIDIHQAYLSYVVPWGAGIRLDLGKHVTHMGYEIIEGTDGANDESTRSFLFGYAIPYTHTGLRCGYTISPHWGATLFLVNGWDVSLDNNRAKTVGAQAIWTPSEGVSLAANYLGGAEQDSSSSNLRHTFDLVGTCKLSDRLSLGVNADYGMEKGVVLSPDAPGGKDVIWRGAAIYVRVGLSPKLALCGRAEMFDDPRGARTGVGQKLEEVTLTPELRITSSLLLRADLRYDYSDQRVFPGKTMSESRRSQPTITLNSNFTF